MTGHRASRPAVMDAVAADLAAAQALLHKVPAGRGRAAEDLVYEAWRAVRQMPEVVRIIEEGAPEEEWHTFERVVRVQAFRLKERAIVMTRKGPVPAEPGTWVAKDREGGLYTVSEVVFQAEGCRQID